MQSNYLLSRGLVLLNGIWFVFMLVQGASPWTIDSGALVAFGANYGPLTLNGQGWRLVSALFVHGGVLHVLLNMLALWQAGEVVERLWGRGRFLVIYFGAGIAASIASLWWRPEVNSVGASGAIFGLIGALLVGLWLRPDTRAQSGGGRTGAGLLLFLVLSLLGGWILPGVDNAAHLGGLAAGTLLGFALMPGISPGVFRVGPATASLAVFALAGGAWMSTKAPAPNGSRAQAIAAHQALLDPVIQGFAQEDAELVMGLRVTLDGVQRGRISRKALMSIIEDELLPGWHRQLERLAAAPGGEDNPRLLALRRYGALRQQSLEALLTGVRTHDDAWLQAAAQSQKEAEAALVDFGLIFGGGAFTPGAEGASGGAEP